MCTVLTFAAFLRGTVQPRSEGGTLTGHRGGKTPDASAGFNALAICQEGRDAARLMGNLEAR
jgi:hypothetical protein